MWGRLGRVDNSAEGAQSKEGNAKGKLARERHVGHFTGSKHSPSSCGCFPSSSTLALMPILLLLWAVGGRRPAAQSGCEWCQFSLGLRASPRPALLTPPSTPPPVPLVYLHWQNTPRLHRQAWEGKPALNDMAAASHHEHVASARLAAAPPSGDGDAPTIGSVPGEGRAHPPHPSWRERGRPRAARSPPRYVIAECCGHIRRDWRVRGGTGRVKIGSCASSAGKGVGAGGGSSAGRLSGRTAGLSCPVDALTVAFPERTRGCIRCETPGG